jgi:multidrug efflux system membrane fusion protein
VKVEALAPNDTTAPSVGRITFVDNTVDPTTGAIRNKGTFPNETRHLWPGQFVNVSFTPDDRIRHAVVSDGRVQTAAGQYVFVVSRQTVELRTSPSRARWTRIVIKRAQGR